MAKDCLENICGEYEKLSRHLRKLVVNGTRIDKKEERPFANLRNPNTKPATTLHLTETRFKVSFLPRLLCRTGNGVRNLNVGDDEIVVCMYGLFNDVYDFRKGIDFVQGFPEFRYIFGNYTSFNLFTDNVFEAFEGIKPENMADLESGNYESYVARNLALVDTHLSTFKDFLSDTTYISKTL